jgi:diguanylate cyclase (GGDEF)-like protein
MSTAVRTRARSGLLVIGLVSILIVNGGAVLFGYKSRTGTEANARRELQNLALTISEQTDQAFSGLALVQTSVVAEIRAQKARSLPEFLGFIQPYDFHRGLRDRVSGLPQVQSLSIIDGMGKLASSSRSWPTRDVDVSDREYFKVLSSDASLSSYISEPLQNRLDGRWTVYVAQPVRGDNGAFLGLVLGALDLDYFEQFYETISLGPDSAISLLRRDGTLLARYPRRSRTLPAGLAAKSPLFRDTLAHSDHGTIRQISEIDRADRFVSGRASKRYPIVVAVSTKADRVLSPWRSEVFSLSAATLLLNLLIVTAMMLGLRQLQNGARSEHMARHDALTGLPNRLSLREWLSEALKSKAGFSLALFDLDDFKTVNDLFGHVAGDALLKKIGIVLRKAAGPRQMVARLGGDEFALLARAEDVSDMCERISAALREPIDIEGRALAVRMSVGIASAPRDAACPDELFRKADMALYAAKAAGKGVSRHFHEALESVLLERQALEADLRSAIATNEMELYLQPIVQIETGAATGFEALLRWRHATRGMISPAEFIPIAESSGLIVPLGEWVLREACCAAAEWDQPLTISVNLSSVQFASDDLLGTIKRALRDADLAPGRLEVEITESVRLQTDDKVLATLHSLRELGVRVALDDFGTGYSSLSYLASFPFDRIKIDRSFVMNMLTDQTSAMIVQATIALANSLGLASTTEGVETVEQLEALRKAGATAAQGFLFSPPLPAVAAAERLGLLRPDRPAQPRRLTDYVLAAGEAYPDPSAQLIKLAASVR